MKLRVRHSPPRTDSTSQQNSTRKKGFTAVEVFLVLTMLVIVVGLMIIPAFRLLDAFKVRPLETTILNAIRMAHTQAQTRHLPVMLSYFAPSNSLRICTANGIVLEAVTLDATDQESIHPPAPTFYRILPEDPEADTFAYEREDDPVPHIWFYPCGVSLPFAVTFMQGSDEYILVLDPFSSRPRLRMINGESS